MLPGNRKKVAVLLRILAPLVVGKEIMGKKCGCGCQNQGPARAQAIHPCSECDPGLEAYWYLWTVDMICVETGRRGTDADLSCFVDKVYLYRLFSKQFGAPIQIDRAYENGMRAYGLEVKYADRVYDNYPAGMSIFDNDKRTRLYVHWGREQDAAQALFDLHKSNKHSFPKEGNDYANVQNILREMRNVEVFQNGPDPIYRFESDFIMDFGDAMQRTNGDEYSGVCILSVGFYSDHRGTVFTVADIVFNKHEHTF